MNELGYPIHQSPLYRLTTRRKLASLLKITPSELEALARAKIENYKCFYRETKPGKARWIEWPNPPLRKVQKRITALLGRITPPEYLHSGYKGRSYITNAEQHSSSLPSGKIDIKKFFPSAKRERVARSFRDQFQCPLDVAAVLANLTTFQDHVPTGGNSSTMISFWAYRPMFDEIYTRAKEIGAIMTCCVDDMTFTGAEVKPSFINEVAIIIRKNGLKTHKVHFFAAGVPKIVTGVAVTPKGLRLPNKRRLKLHQAFVDVRATADPTEKLKVAKSLLGRATEAQQVESRFGGAVAAATKILSDAVRANDLANG